MSSGLKALAERVRSDSYFLGSALSAFARSEQLDRASLSHWLGHDDVDLDRLALCRHPRLDAAGFRDDVDRIACRFAINAERLGEIVRHAQVLAALRLGGRQQGLVAAARDAVETTSPAESGDDHP